MRKIAFLVLASVLLASARASAATIVVTNTNDSGPGSLRQAILDSNTGGVADVITFNIPGSGPFVITVSSPLPAFTGSVRLDATTQPGYATQPFIGTGGTVGVDGLLLPKLRSPIVEVFGAGLGGNGLVFDGSNNSTLTGLHVWGFTGTNVVFSNSTDATVFRNLIGATPTFGDPGPGLQAAINLLVDGNNPSVRENLVAYSSTLDNVLITTQRGDIIVEGNELVGTLRNSASPILLRGTGLPNRYIGRNLIRDSPGYGLDIVGGIEQMTISNNTVRNNGAGGVNPAGIRLTNAGANSSRNNVLDHNIVTGNLGPGILITGNTLSSNRGNTITRNSIHGNGGIGIDLAWRTVVGSSDRRGSDVERSW
jgi:Right handed beta helix region